ncbi:hypothetical protein E0Z10_g8224 [Xylaria hypoxylon]|uniref:Uncharacterized protein n=1 Tax=Xylaria hypoxylon TaxID=37992 RepID=A0A4Z0YSS1_9PEZI|nr:hypothetical protein E0Z10_g8224 [Xylaria hypoxylon]
MAAKQRPLSPWALRHGTKFRLQDEVYDRAPVEHSGIAPEQNQGIFSSGDEMDRFFCTDQKNAEKFSGVPPWMLGTMRRALRFSRRGIVPGGHARSLSEGSILNVHSAIYYTECIEVNEDSWFSFFKKDRWWDTVWFDLDPLIYGPWTVDKPKIWAHLRIAIELANRILNALIKDRHTFLHTILFGQLALWSDPALQPAPCPEPHPGAKVLLSHAFIKQLWIKKNGDEPWAMDIMLNSSDDEWRERIEYLCTEQQWGFGPGEDMDSENFLGLHMSQYILLNIEKLRKLKDTHPLFTALGALDFQNDEFAYHEPESTDVINIVTNPYKLTWPMPNQNLSHGLTADGHPAFREGELEVVTLIPALWVSKILSEEFWQNKSIPRKSDNFFHSIDYFRSVFPYRADNSATRPAPVIEQREHLADQQAQGLLSEELVDLIIDWELRESMERVSVGNVSSKEMVLSVREAFKTEFVEQGHVSLCYECIFYDSYVMPIRLVAEKREELDISIWTSLTPSSRNPRPERSYTRRLIEKDYYPTFVPASQLFDPFDRNGQDIPVGTFNHIDYLDQVLKLVNHFTRGGMPVSKAWIDEIVRVEAKIRERRIDLGKQGIPAAESLAKWADDAWDFKIPEYDPTEHKYNVINKEFEIVSMRSITGEKLMN